VITPVPFYGIGEFYADFRQTTDAEVAACLDQAAAPERGSGPPPVAAPAPRTATPAGTLTDERPPIPGSHGAN